VYLETASSPYGSPLESFIADPPVPNPFGSLPKLGVALIEREEPLPLAWGGGVHRVTHVVDWVGAESYPYAADVLEEGRRFGFSRKVNPGLEFHRLTVFSRLILVHARGLVTNRGAVPADVGAFDRAGLGQDACALFARTEGRDRSHWEPGHPACNRYHFADAPPTEAVVTWAPGEGPNESGRMELRPAEGETAEEFVRRVRRDYDAAPRNRKKGAPASVRFLRRIADTVYPVAPPAFNVGPRERTPDVLAEPAIIASLPLGSVVCIRARDGSHAKTAERVRGDVARSKNALPFTVEDE